MCIVALAKFPIIFASNMTVAELAKWAPVMIGAIMHPRNLNLKKRLF
jgi:hypothetical protein